MCLHHCSTIFLLIFSQHCLMLFFRHLFYFLFLFFWFFNWYFSGSVSPFRHSGLPHPNICFILIKMLEKTLESPLDCKEIQPVHPKGDQSWVFIGRTDVEAETPILWPPDSKSWLIGKYPDAGKDWRQEEKGTADDGMVGWHHQLSGHEFELPLGVGDGQGGLACCGPWGRRIRQNWATELN